MAIGNSRHDRSALVGGCFRDFVNYHHDDRITIRPIRTPQSTRLAPFLEGNFSGATFAPGSATAALWLVSAFVMLAVVILFRACSAHDDSSLCLARKARPKFPDFSCR